MKSRYLITCGRRLFLCGAALLLAASSQLVFAASEPSTTAGVDWLKPSGGPYPQLGRNERVWIKVSLERQRVYIMGGDRSLYTMVASTGLDAPAADRTPEGVYSIQRERGLAFYNAKLGEGARFWVSFLGHGKYLFHSVPTDRHDRIIVDEARKLGRKASHGCIRLTLPDAKWIYKNIRYGTKVVIGP